MVGPTDKEQDPKFIRWNQVTSTMTPKLWGFYSGRDAASGQNGVAFGKAVCIEMSVVPLIPNVQDSGEPEGHVLNESSP